MLHEGTTSDGMALTHLAHARDEPYHNPLDAHGPLRIPLPAPAPQQRILTRLAPSP